jgi:hypothetical protein
LEVASLQSAAELEHWLRMNVGANTEVTLLGRFDSVHFVRSEAEMESVVLGGEGGSLEPRLGQLEPPGSQL